MLWQYFSFYVIQSWWPFFDIFLNGHVLKTQRFEINLFELPQLCFLVMYRKKNSCLIFIYLRGLTVYSMKIISQQLSISHYYRVRNRKDYVSKNRIIRTANWPERTEKFTWQVKLATLGNSMKETLDKTKTNLKHKLEVEDVRSQSKWAAS